jgi:hypothetical protein
MAQRLRIVYGVKPTLGAAPYSTTWSNVITGSGYVLDMGPMASWTTADTVWMTNAACRPDDDGMACTVALAGGAAGASWDLFGNTTLSSDDGPWTWLGRGLVGHILQLTNLPAGPVFLRLGNPSIDSDHDGLTDAFERLVSRSDPNNPSSNGSGLPDGWLWAYFGSLGYYATNVDTDGNTLLADYQNGVDPNPIKFSVQTGCSRIRSSSALLQVSVTGGLPFYYAALLDSTNFGTACWNEYTTSNLLVELGPTQGWHDIWVGLRGLPQNAQQSWQRMRVCFDSTPPLITITNPTMTTLSQVVVQVQGFCDEALSSICYDLSNSAGVVTGQPVVILDRCFDTNLWAFTTNFFQAFDVRLTNGLNSSPSMLRIWQATSQTSR